MSTHVAGAATVVALVAAGCGTGGTTSSSQPPAVGRVSHNARTRTSLTDATGVVGRDCDRVSATGAGTVRAMASVPVATAVARSRLLT
jgi:hypothetical protein